MPKIGSLLALSSSLVLAACADVEDQPGAELATANLEAPLEFTNARGKKFRRWDRIAASERARILQRGRPTGGRPTVDSLAEQLRAHVLRRGVHYVQLEPDRDAAMRALGNQGARTTAASRPRAARSGIFDTDDRDFVANTNEWPRTTVGFNEASGTSTMIGPTTASTAAHVVYQTQDPMVTDGWRCRDGTINNCVAYQRWRFGVNGTNGATPWIADCIGIAIPTAFVALTSSSDPWDFARWDFAVLTFDNCPAMNLGWMGTQIFDDTTIRGIQARALGYPAFHPCPHGSPGTSLADCPGGTMRYTGVQPNFTGAQMMTRASDDLKPARRNGDHVIETTMDVTAGESGMALVFFSGSDPFVIASSLSNGPAENNFHRWNAETHAFFSANAMFP